LFLRSERHAEPPADPAGEQKIGNAVVAVLPFENLSASAEDAYLATGVPEMVQDRLAIVPGLLVIAGSSSGRVAGIPDPKEMGRKLGARFLVLGSTQRAGEKLRVAARLVDTQSGAIVWSTRIDRTVDDLFAVQDSIAANVTDELKRQLRGIASPPEQSRHQPPVEALIAYLQGRASLARHTVRGAEQAAERFERAVELDPEFAAALAGLYDARMLAAERRHENLDAALKANAQLIDRALAIEPDCGPAYVARAIWTPGDVKQQEADFTRGLALDPTNGRGLVAYSEFLDRQGRYDEGAKVLDRAMLVDPLSPRLHFRLVMREFGRTTFLQTREPGLRHVLEIDPDYQPALQRYGKTKWMLNGQLTEATQILEHAIETDPENPWSRQTAVAIYLDLGDEESARQVADGTPSSRRTAELLLELYDGDWRRAGEVAYSPAGREYNLEESWGAAEAVRDHALRSGDLRRGIEFLEERYGLAGDEPKLRINNFRAAAYLAQLLRAAGETGRADALLERLPGEIDASLPRFGAVYALRTKATVQLLAGDTDAALATLRASFTENDLTQWWYTLQHDPLWLPLRNDPRFEAIEAQVRARVAQEAAALAELRRSGRIIDRSRPERNEPP
jgi:TolB-like protein